MRIKEIEDVVIAGSRTLDGWQVRNARFIDSCQYDYICDWRMLNNGDIWARQGETAFIKRKITVPGDWTGRRVALELLTGGEGLLSINGKPYHGVDDNRGYILLASEARGGEEFDCEIEIKTGGYWEYLPENPSTPYVLSSARLIAIDRAVEESYFDFKVAYDSAAGVKDPVLQEAILLAIKEAFHTIDFRDKRSPEFREQLISSREFLCGGLGKLGWGKCPGSVHFTGHSHIDVAWLWPLKETMRKVGRTYSTVTALMDEFPDYHFNCSQVPLFIFLKEQYPSVYERVKARIQEGRFEPVGGTWVEHDTNLISGESMVRQCLYGKRFFRDDFGVDVRVGWLPDVFGDSWTLPQIYKKAGLDYFMTAKFHANEIHRFPYNTFWWQGIDGTRIFTHVVHDIVTGYNAHVNPCDMVKQWDDYIGKPENPDILTPFGYGDGGGGPTREMLEYMPRLSEMPGIPKAHTGRVHDYFDRIAANTKDLPVWNGEIYFERHRGTYTSQAKNKKYNRRSELLLREAEIFGVLSGGYDKAAVTDAWQTVLLNQFHDIIPGSSIGEVYTCSHAQYEEVLEQGASIRKNALQTLVKEANTTGEGIPVAVFNSLSWPRMDIVSLPLPGDGPFKVMAPDGKEVGSQSSEGAISFVAGDVPSCGYSVYRLVESTAIEAATPFEVDGSRITTPYYEITLGDDGSLLRLFDRINAREVLREGDRANVLQVFEDKPCQEDAWDIEIQYQDKVWEFEPDGQPEVTECGSVRLTVNRKMKYGNSTLQQKMALYAHSPRIDFITKVDWQERKTMLKTAFPVDIHSTKAAYEIAFGAIERPTHWNTDWDKAAFEVSGHKWADLSEAGYGVSILNDCKYGWDIKENVMRLTLLRSPMYPDAHADLGVHEFTYSLLPHTGDWRCGTVRAGGELNLPLIPIVADKHEGTLGKTHAFITIDAPNVIVDTVKCAEESGETIVRVYEAHGGRCSATLVFDRAIESVVETNLLEEDLNAVEFDGSGINFYIKPFEIKTYKVSFISK